MNARRTDAAGMSVFGKDPDKRGIIAWSDTDSAVEDYVTYLEESMATWTCG